MTYSRQDLKTAPVILIEFEALVQDTAVFNNLLEWSPGRAKYMVETGKTTETHIIPNEHKVVFLPTCADNVQTMCRQTCQCADKLGMCRQCADKARQTADKLQTKPDKLQTNFVWLCLHIVCTCLVCLHIVCTCLVCLHIVCTLSAIDLWTHIVLSITISHVQSKELAWLGIWRWRSHPAA